MNRQLSCLHQSPWDSPAGAPSLVAGSPMFPSHLISHGSLLSVLLSSLFYKRDPLVLCVSCPSAVCLPALFTVLSHESFSATSLGLPKPTESLHSTPTCQRLCELLRGPPQMNNTCDSHRDPLFSLQMKMWPSGLIINSVWSWAFILCFFISSRAQFNAFQVACTQLIFNYWRKPSFKKKYKLSQTFCLVFIILALKRPRKERPNWG